MPGTEAESNRSGETAACEQALRALLDAFRPPAPDLEAAFTFPQRMRITDVKTGEIRHEEPGRCWATVTLHAGEVHRTYTLAVTLEGGRGTLLIRGEEELEEKVALVDAGGAIHPEDIEALHEVLSADIAVHFGTDS